MKSGLVQMDMFLFTLIGIQSPTFDSSQPGDPAATACQTGEVWRYNYTGNMNTILMECLKACPALGVGVGKMPTWRAI